MKKVFQGLTILALIITLGFSTFAQAQVKIGYVDFNSIITAMPGIDSVKTKMQTYQKSLTDQMDAMRAEFENKYNDYQQNSAGMSDLIRQTKEKELQDLQVRIDAFQQKAQTDLQTRQQELLQPFIDKAKKAVKDVAKENKYNYIFNGIEDILLYSEPADDVMPLVKKKLGMQ